MKRKIIICGAIGVILLAGAILFYFLYFGHPSRQSLAWVNGEKITVEQFNQELARVEVPYRDMFKEEPHKFLDGLIIKRLVLQEARKQGFSASARNYKDTTKDAMSPEEFLIIELMKKKFPSPPAVTRQEVEIFYGAFKDRMGGKPLSQVAPIIQAIIQEEKQQERLNQFLKELSDHAKVEIEEGRLKKIASKPPESNTEDDFKKALTSGKPVLVDFGSNSCIPCRQMRPILNEIKKDYSEKASVLLINIYKHEDLAKQYKIQLIPTLVFFDAKGKEVFRHMGAWDKNNIVSKLKEIGMSS